MTGCFHCHKMPDETNRILLRCSRCKAAMYCDPECQRAHWRDGHRRVCRPPPVRPTGGERAGTFVLPAEAPKMIDLGPGPGKPLPLEAFHELDGKGRTAVRLMFSDHAGPEMLRPYVMAYFNEDNDDTGNNVEGLLSVQWAIVTNPMHNDDDARRVLGPGDAVFNTSSFAGEVEALLAEGIITDTGRTYKMGFYAPHPICHVNLPIG
eukprot:CAMPEP_0198214914 /NCGR_PEP_ID=MMETSP1445-20131203/45362_1 /TAXON_ID=36898 /ORGANISM="Pyramimonas sp., Strain CCMP2087" /LENGTH=206 /DNA_ID=CAMNT_0043890339 /DNA_START=249 /DNA_END=865 /DNA_ORIENTATION=+